MVLPIQTQLAHTSNTIKIMSLGLSNLSQMITGLGPLLSGAFGAGLTAYEGLSNAMSGFFDEQIKGANDLAKALSDLIPKSTREAISNVLSGGGLGSNPSLGSGINDSNRHLFKFTPKENFQRFPKSAYDALAAGNAGPSSSSYIPPELRGGTGINAYANLMGGSSPTYNINIEMSGMTDRSDKSKMARDISDLIQAETTRRADFHRSHGRL